VEEGNKVMTWGFEKEEEREEEREERYAVYLSIRADAIANI
jgi:hypothetical protein